MPQVELNGASIYYEDSAPNDNSKPVIVFAHGLLWNLKMFDPQVAALSDQFRCVAFDFRGQGRSQITKDGYDMDNLTRDVVALLDVLNIERCHFLGLSMGGFVGLRLAIDFPERLSSLMLLNTTADPEETAKVAQYSKFLASLRWLGMRRVSKKVMPIMFGEAFLTDKSRKSECKAWQACMQNNHKMGVTRATLGVIEREGVFEQLQNIKTPTLIVAGMDDKATPHRKSERMHFAIAGSKLAMIARAGHSSTIEAPDQVNAVIQKFLSQLNFESANGYSSGL